MSLPSPAPLAFEFRRYLSNPSCPRCGNHLLAAEASEFLRDGHIRHSWACEGCGAGIPDGGYIDRCTGDRCTGRSPACPLTCSAHLRSLGERKRGGRPKRPPRSFRALAAGYPSR